MAGQPIETVEIPDDLRALVASFRARLIEAVAEQDDTLLPAWLDGAEPLLDAVLAYLLTPGETMWNEHGDIAGIVGLKGTLTGQTMTGNHAADRTHPLVLEQITIAQPVIDVAIKPTRQADQQRLGKALHALVRGDPSLRMRQDAESGQTILFVIGELQLAVTVEKLRARHRMNVGVGRPQVAYREAIAHAAEDHAPAQEADRWAGPFC